MDATPKVIRRDARILVLCLVGIVACAMLSACPPPSLQTPQGRTAYTANQVAIAIGTLQDAVMAAHSTKDLDGRPLLSTSTTRKVMSFSLDALDILDKTPDGWQATVRIAYLRLKDELGDADREKLATPLKAVDAVLEVLPGGSAP